MDDIIARVGVYGDMHLCSKNYGAHRDYAKESLQYFKEITEVTKKRQLTHLIGTGDFSFGRFHSLEYRESVEKELQEQFGIVNGNRYEIFGNHDKAGYGMTERDYYINKGLLKPSENIVINNVNINMVDYGKYLETDVNIVDDNEHINFIIAHDYFKFKDTQLPNYGKGIDLDTFEKWYGLDYLICGHIHKIIGFTGSIVKGIQAHPVTVHYLGCMCRPAYREGMLDEIGQVLVLSIHKDGKVDYDIEDIPLWSIDESFNIEEKQKEKEKQIEKDERVDISDIIKQLTTHDRNVGNPEDIIKDMSGINSKYKNKAIELLKLAQG